MNAMMVDADSKLFAKLRMPDGQRVATSAIWNTSLGGIFVEESAPMAFGVEVVCEFEPQERGARAVRCRGFVVWTTRQFPARAPGKQGFAVRLTDIGIADMRILAEQVGRDL